MQKTATTVGVGGATAGPAFVILWNSMHPEAPFTAEEAVIIGSFVSSVTGVIAGLLLPQLHRLARVPMQPWVGPQPKAKPLDQAKRPSPPKEP